MYDKRFEYVKGEGFKEDGFYISPNDVVDLLNKQHQEIIELREAMKRMMGDMMGVRLND